MRDVAVTLIIFGSLPFILRRPYIGVLMWTWLAFMNPHRLTWGFAYDMPFALIVAAFTLVGLLLASEPKKLPMAGETVLLLLFLAWMSLTTVFAAYPADAWQQLEKVSKILLMVFVSMMLLQSKQRINMLIWIMTLSVAFYGIKGGLFTIKGGGVYHVWGPPGSFMEGNNEIALALVMTVPLLRYLQTVAPRIWIKHAMTAAMVLTTLAIVGSQSRGALVGVIAMGTLFWLKSRNKAAMSVLGAGAIVLVLTLMPQQWFERMETIQTYEQDSSAMRRINAWQMAFNLAKDRPLGGGFETFQPGMFAIYAPASIFKANDAHSIYFEVLGEHGFVGLILFLMLGLMTWRSCAAIIRRCRGDPEKRWAVDLAAMIQVSLVGYATAGAFLGLAYFDYYYTLVAAVVVCKTLLLKQPEAESAVRASVPDAVAAQRAG